MFTISGSINNERWLLFLDETHSNSFDWSAQKRCSNTHKKKLAWLKALLDLIGLYASDVCHNDLVPFIYSTYLCIQLE